MRKNNVFFFILIALCLLTVIPSKADELKLSDNALEAGKNAKQIIVFTRFVNLKNEEPSREVKIKTWKTKEDWLKKPEPVQEDFAINYEMDVYEKNKAGLWKRVIYSSCCDGMKNLNDLEGVFNYITASEINQNPGKTSAYIQLNDTYYWCEDPQSPYFYQFVSTRKHNDFDIKKSKSISDFPDEFAYSLIIRSAADTKSISGTTLLLQCKGKGDSYEHMGGIAIMEDDMHALLRHLKKNSVIVIEEKQW